MREYAPPRLSVVTVALPEPVDLLSLLPAEPVVSWVRDGDGLVGWGQAARLDVYGQERFSRAQRWWAQVCDAADVRDAVSVPGTGPTAFASFTFASGPAASIMIVPQVVIGRRHDKSWLTVVSEHPGTRPAAEPTLAEVLAAPARIQAPGRVREEPGSLSELGWRAAVDEAVARVRAGGLDKVVLARDTVVVSEHDLDPRFLMTQLSAAYPECWTFTVAGLVGATPELLVRRTGSTVVSRVLAGTVHRAADSSADGRLAAALLSSDKDLVEHLYAVESVAAALARHCTDLRVPASPSILALANVQHLATDVSGMLADDASAVALAASLHPTAAVCGTPTERAAAVIDELEGMDRGRYAGPVGWVDSRGDGEFGIALRCGSLEAPRTLRLYAGCGIVAGSTADGEWAESEAKLSAMRTAVGASAQMTAAG